MAVKTLLSDTTLTAKTRNGYSKNVGTLENKINAIVAYIVEIKMTLADLDASVEEPVPTPVTATNHVSSNDKPSPHKSIKYHESWPKWTRSHNNIDDFLSAFSQAVIITNGAETLKDSIIGSYLALAIVEDHKRRLFFDKVQAEKASDWETVAALFRNTCRSASDMVKVNEELPNITLRSDETFHDFRGIEDNNTPDDTRAVYLQV
ncbi:hypothetical protein BGX27_001409 [Mortierella sp. AM989]|nr:hypothetical protein BGX27_001409 [Mortierella sp. AM989]